jgi:hypothetical protein
MSDDEAGHDESTARRSYRRSGTAPEVERKVYRDWALQPATVLPFLRSTTSAMKPAPSRSQIVHHLRGTQVNRDPSRSCAQGGTGAIVRRARADREAFLGNAASLRVSNGIEPTARSRCHSSADRDRRGCRRRPRGGNRRKESDALTRMANRSTNNR